MANFSENRVPDCLLNVVGMNSCQQGQCSPVERAATKEVQFVAAPGLDIPAMAGHPLLVELCAPKAGGH